MTEQDSQSSAVLRREAEQLYLDLWGFLPTDSSMEANIQLIEAFARRQRAQALESAAVDMDDDIAEQWTRDEVTAWLRARAAAEGTET